MATPGKVSLKKKSRKLFTPKVQPDEEDFELEKENSDLIIHSKVFSRPVVGQFSASDILHEGPWTKYHENVVLSFIKFRFLVNLFLF